MQISPLDFMPIEVRKLQSMDKSSKEYKKEIKNLRFKYRVLLNYPINKDEPAKLSYYFGCKYKKYFFHYWPFL